MAGGLMVFLCARKLLQMAAPVANHRNSLLIGDALSDLIAGQAAGLRQTVLVRTGLGAEQEHLAKPASLKPFLTFDTLEQALAALIPSA